MTRRCTLAALGALALGVAQAAPEAPAPRPGAVPATAATWTLPPPADLPGSWYVWANGDDVLDLAIEGPVLWAGSRGGGLVRWDSAAGTYTQYLRPQDPLGGNTVHRVVIDERGWKWLATSGGLTVLDDSGTADGGDDRWHNFTVASTGGGLPTDDVRAVAVDGTVVWVAGAQVPDRASGGWRRGGLGRLDTSGTFDTADDTWAPIVTFEDTRRSPPGGRVTLGLVSDSINALLVAPDGGLWVAASPHWRLDTAGTGPGRWRQVHGGLSRLDTKGTPDTSDDEWRAYSCETPLRDTTGRPLVSCYVTDLAADHQGNTWAAVGGFGAIAFRSDSVQLVGSAVARFDRSSGLDGVVEAVAAGNGANEMWFGLRTAGAARIDHGGTLTSSEDDSVMVLRVTDGLARDRVQAIAAAGQSVWLGTGPRYGVGGGVDRYDETAARLAGRLQMAGGAGPAAPSNFMTSVATGAPGSPWANRAWVGLGSRAQRLFGHGVAVLDLGASASGADDSWSVHDTATTDDDGAAPYSGVAGDNVQAVLVDGERVWVGSAEANWDEGRRAYLDGGLAVYEGARWTARRTDSGLSDGSVTSLARGCDGRLWIGTGTDWSFGTGVDILTPGPEVHDPAADTWARVAFPNLASNNPRGIAADCGSGAMWVAGVHHARGGFWSDGGVARLDTASGTWTRYDASTGLVSFSNGFITGEGTAMAVGPDGRGWVGAFGDRETTEEALIAAAPYWPATLNVWNGDAGWSAVVFDGLGWIADVAVDAAGSVWAATSRGGLARSGPMPEQWADDRGLPGLVVLEPGGAWAGVYQALSGVPAPDVGAVFAAADGSVWIATEGWGLARYSPEVPTPTPTSSPTATATPRETVEATSTPRPSPSATRPSPTPPSPTAVSPTATATGGVSATATPTATAEASATSTPQATSPTPTPPNGTEAPDGLIVYLPTLLQPFRQ